MENLVEVIITVIALSFWILFPIGMFLSVSHVDKNTDQIIKLGQHRHHSEPLNRKVEEKKYAPVPFDWHHPIIYFRRWLQQEG